MPKCRWRRPGKIQTATLNEASRRTEIRIVRSRLRPVTSRRDCMTPTAVIRLHPDDGVLIARASLPPGIVIAEGVSTLERIPAGHKVAIRPIATGEPIRRYGQIIGFATAPIAPGQHVHTQNCGMGDFAKDYAFSADVVATPNFDLPASFDGIRRSDGRVATRNYIGILTSVNCSAHVAGIVADAFKKNPFTGDNPLADFPNVDGVVALTHKTGCGMTQDEPLTILRRTLGGYARHVNFSAVIVLGLGCEVNQIGGLMKEQKLAGRLRELEIQEIGGTRKTVQAGVAFVREALQEANNVKREPVSASELTVALQCGGADGYSGLSANLVCFTTGRGSVFGCKPAPSIKLATNTPMYKRMEDDMDVNCGTILDGEETVQQCGQRIFDLMLKTASGQPTKSESFDFGGAEFAPWVLGATM